MVNAAFLIGISSYPDHKHEGVSNDLTLLVRALAHRKYPPSAIYVYDDTHTTLSELCALLSRIGKLYEGMTEGSCYLHISASGALSLEPLAAGVLPSNGDELDFSSAFPFANLNQYLPVRPGIHVVVTLDT